MPTRLSSNALGSGNDEEDIVLHRHAGVEFDHLTECVALEVHQRSNIRVLKEFVTRIRRIDRRRVAGGTVTLGSPFQARPCLTRANGLLK